MLGYAVWNGAAFVPLYGLRLTSISAVRGYVFSDWVIAQR